MNQTLTSAIAVHKWLYVHLLGQFFVVLWSSYFYNVVMEIFIPIAARAGSARNPDALISIICSATTLFMLSYLVSYFVVQFEIVIKIFFQIPLTKLLKSSVTKYLTLISIFLISIFLAISTPWGFPYQNDSSGNPTVQRHFIAVRDEFNVINHVCCKTYSTAHGKKLL